VLQGAVDPLLAPIDVSVGQAKWNALAQADHTLRPAGRDALTEGIMTGEDPRHLVLEQTLALDLSKRFP